MRHLVYGLLAVAILCAGVTTAKAAGIKSYTPVLTGGLIADFEGKAEDDLIGAGVYPGVTFSQPDGGRPMIDNFPWIFAYGASSGSGVLTGSTEGGAPFPTIAGIIATFDASQSAVQAFFSDTSPLGDYTITAFGAGSSVLETVTVLASETLPPGYAGGTFPPPGTFPLPGIFVGFVRPTADIVAVQFGPSSASSDSFAIDDLRVSAVPEPSSLVQVGLGILGLLGYGWRRWQQLA